MPSLHPFATSHSMIALPKVFTASLLLAILALGDSRQCFWPDHSPAPSNFTECNAGAAQSACCQNSDACLSNGLCLQQVGFANRIVRGACTDSTFSNAACPAQCTSGMFCQRRGIQNLMLLCSPTQQIRLLLPGKRLPKSWRQRPLLLRRKLQRYITTM